MSKRVSLCIIRVEMDEASGDRSSRANSEDMRPSQNITVESYGNKVAGPKDLRLLPGSRESSPNDLEKEQVDFFFGNPLVEITKGIIHLYKENEVTDVSGEAPSLTLCLLAVPATVSCRDLLSFTAACQKDIQLVRILRDGSPHKYMALLTFRSRGAAFEFRETFGGTAYSSLEPAGICHAVWVRRVECFSGSTPPPAGATELPTCPVCLERMDESVEGLITVQCAHSFHAGCLTGWTDGSCPVCRCAQSPDPPAATECSECAESGLREEAVESSALWICLICGHVGCGRYQEGHAAQHFKATNHTYALQLETNRVWDYAGDNFVHRLLQNKGDGKLVATGGPTDPETCGDPCSQEKVDSIQLEYTNLLAAQLETQRHYYEELINKHKESTSVEIKALYDKLQDSEKQRAQLNKKLQSVTAKISTLQTELSEEKAIAKANSLAREELTKKAAVTDSEIVDLKEQVRDLTFYLEATSAIEKRADCQELQGGQIEVPAPTQSKTKKKRGRR